MQEILLGGGGRLYFQTPLPGLVGIDAIGSAENNCGEDCLRRIKLDWEADKPALRVLLGSAHCMRGHWAKSALSPTSTSSHRQRATLPAGPPRGAGLRAGIYICRSISVHIRGLSTHRGGCFYQLSSPQFSVELPYE